MIRDHNWWRRMQKKRQRLGQLLCKNNNLAETRRNQLRKLQRKIEEQEEQLAMLKVKRWRM